ncbi:MAG: Gldg family protein [Candidatus Rokubacteria bacterium]|nr:Gldg family protein [Candidatus Rokubacteria bacterium]
MDRLSLVNTLWFAGWCAAILVLFVLGVRLPLQPRFSRLKTLLYVWGVVVGSIGLAALANAALYLHDVHFDLTREQVFTPSRQALRVVEGLTRDVTLTYFFQSQDQDGRRAKDMVEVLARRNPRLHVRTIDPDKQPSIAETYGVRLYNAAVVEADGRRILVQSTDENDIALGIQRALRQRVITVCFIEGHNEYPVDNFEFHTHFETLQSHSHGESGSAVVQAPGHGIGRMRRALEAQGYDVRKVILATRPAIPDDCAAVVDANPRTTYLPGESGALLAYVARGGAALLMYDLGFVLEPRLAAGLERIGLGLGQEVVVDPLDHYSTDPEMVAVPVYETHPITRNISLTFYPGVRALTLAAPPAGVTVTPLFQSSKDSYAKRVEPVEQHRLGREPAAPPAATGKTGPRLLAVAAEGRWPGAPADARPFRLVLVGDGDFASNSFFPYMANSDLALSMVRWLVREERATAVASRIPVPPMVLLTKRQMQRIFLTVEILLPLGVVLVGAVVWWRRR